MRNRKPFFDTSSIFILLAIAISIFLGYGIVSLGTNQECLKKTQQELIENQVSMKKNQEDIHNMLDSIAKDGKKLVNEIKK